MRRRTILLAAGLLAYFIGATPLVYTRPAVEGRPCFGAGCRALHVVEQRPAALRRPLAALGLLVAPFCSN